MENHDIIIINKDDKILGFCTNVVIYCLLAYERRNGVKLLHSPFGSNDIMVQADTIEKVSEAKQEAERYIVDINKIIIKAAIPLNTGPYLYFLFNKGDLVYIGQTCNICGRMSTHSKGKIFDGIYCTPIDRRSLLLAETVNIRAYRPPLNMTGWDDQTYFATLLNMSGI